MFDQVDRQCSIRPLTLMILAASGCAGLASAAETFNSLLVESARRQDQNAVRALLSQNADVNARSSDGSTALLWSAHWNDLETASLLLGAGADANAANDFRVTPLSEACTNADADRYDLSGNAYDNPEHGQNRTNAVTQEGLRG